MSLGAEGGHRRPGWRWEAEPGRGTLLRGPGQRRDQEVPGPGARTRLAAEAPTTCDATTTLPLPDRDPECAKCPRRRAGRLCRVHVQ